MNPEGQASVTLFVPGAELESIGILMTEWAKIGAKDWDSSERG